MVYQLFMGKDETMNRLKDNNTNTGAQINHWNYENTQTYRVKEHTQGEQLQKQLQLEFKWIKQRCLARIKKTQNKLGGNYPKWGSKSVNEWSDADIDDFILRCQETLQNEHPNLQITNSQTNQLASELLTNVIQYQKLAKILNDIQFWITHDATWLFKHQVAIKNVLQNIKDEELTDTTTIPPNPNLQMHDYIRTYANTIKERRINSKQHNLQRYRIRTTIEQALTTQAKIKIRNKTATSQKQDEGPDL